MREGIACAGADGAGVAGAYQHTVQKRNESASGLRSEQVRDEG